MLIGRTFAQTHDGTEASQHRMACRDMLRTGSPQALCYAAVVMMPQLNSNGALDLFTRNYVFKAGFWAWLLAQTLKVPPSGHGVSCVISEVWLCQHLAVYTTSQQVSVSKLLTPRMACIGLPDVMVMLKSGVNRPDVVIHLLMCTAVTNADLHKEDQAGCVGHPSNCGLWWHAILAFSSLHREPPYDVRCQSHDVNGMLSSLIQGECYLALPRL